MTNEILEASEWVALLLALAGSATVSSAAAVVGSSSQGDTAQATEQSLPEASRDRKPTADRNQQTYPRDLSYEHRHLLKDARRFRDRLHRAERDIARLAKEAEELEGNAAERRAIWSEEVRNYNQLEGIVGFIEARLEGVQYDMQRDGLVTPKKERLREDGEPSRVGDDRTMCVSYNQGWCDKGNACPDRHICCVCATPHHFTRCANRRQICYKWNIGDTRGCSGAGDHTCRREHRCLFCAQMGHPMRTCRMAGSSPPNMCLVWNSCGRGKACSEGTCGRIHRCLKCEGGHPVLLCPENVSMYIEEKYPLFQGERRPKKRCRWD